VIIRTLLMTAVAASLCTLAFAQTDQELAELEAWVTEQGEQYVDRYAAGDIEAIVETFGDDFRLRAIDGEVFEGPDAYVAVVGGYYEAGARLAAEGPHDVGFLSGDVAFSTWTWTFSNENGEVLAAGESLYLYRATPDGGWEWIMQYSAPILPEQ
jgi:ketosteroid isomerase-like protein